MTVTHEDLIARGCELVDPDNRDPSRRTRMVSHLNARYYVDPDHLAEIEAREQADADGMPLRIWNEGMRGLDNQVTKRMIEDIFGVVPQGNLPQNLKDLMAARKSHRRNRP